jgi:hypothetical protein
MPHSAVTLDTINHLLGITSVGSNFINQTTMTPHTILLQNCLVAGLDANRLVEIL